MISQQLSGYKSGSISIAACEIETFVISTLACRLYPLNTRHHLVAYHKKGLVRVFTSSGQEDALAAYRQISKQWCKVLMSVPDNQVCSIYVVCVPIDATARRSWKATGATSGGEFAKPPYAQLLSLLHVSYPVKCRIFWLPSTKEIASEYSAVLVKKTHRTYTIRYRNSGPRF